MKVLAFHDKGWYDSRRTEFRLYDQLCRAYNVEFKMIRDRNDLLAEKCNRLVVFDEDGLIKLSKFNHPEDSIYLFGRSGQILVKEFPNATSVRIETPKKIPLFGAVACGIVLEDMRRKHDSIHNK